MIALIIVRLHYVRADHRGIGLWTVAPAVPSSNPGRLHETLEMDFLIMFILERVSAGGYLGAPSIS